MEMQTEAISDVTWSMECVMHGNKTRVTVKTFLPWSNPANVINRNTYLLVEEFLFCVFNPLLFVIGVPTNILNLIVFYRQGLRHRMMFCLFSLAVVDMLYVALCFLIGSFCFVGHVSPEHELWWKWYVRKYSQGVCNALMYSSGCLSMIIAVERCACVWLPAKVPTLVTTKTMAAIVVVTFLLLQLVCLVDPLQLDVTVISDPCTGDKVLTLAFSQLYEDHNLVFDIVQGLGLTTISVLTFIVVSMATAGTVVGLNKVIRWRQTHGVVSTMDEHQRAVGRMLVVLSSVYIITASPNILLILACLLVEDLSYEGRFVNIFEASFCACRVLSVVNSSANFFVYLSRSARFRQELRSLVTNKGSICPQVNNKPRKHGEVHPRPVP